MVHETFDGSDDRVLGRGPALVLVHGSAMDRRGFSSLFQQLTDRFRVIAYNRRGPPVTREIPGPIGIDVHAQDLARIIEVHAAGPCLIYGSSFGAVVALELARQPEAAKRLSIRGVVLGEPPLPASDEVPPASEPFFETFRQTYESDPVAAGRFFMEQVLEPSTLARMAPEVMYMAASKHAEIASDCHDLLRYRVRYGALRTLHLPVLLLQGSESLPIYAQTLSALAAHLPRARREILPAAGHLVHQSPSFRSALEVFDHETQPAG
ncbi:MAG: alpha/beta fold hydrolase [Myxococcota bacterium]